MSGAIVIFEPASAIAASRCLAARVRDPDHRVTASHPRRCGWCDYPTDVLDGVVRGFNAWAGYSERTGTYAHHELRVWAELGKDEQLAQILAAQVLEDEVWQPVEGGSIEPAHGGVGASRSSAGAENVGPLRGRVGPDPDSKVAVPVRPDWLAGPK